MSTTIKFVWLFTSLALISGFIVLAMWGIPAPNKETHKQFTLEQFNQHRAPSQ